MTSLLRTIPLILVLSVAAGLASPGAEADSTKHHAVVQTFEPARNNGTPLVQVRFSNTVIGTFMIDTGEIESVITEPFARKAGFPLVEDENSLAIGLHHVRFVQAPEIKLANLTVVKQTFRVVSQDFLPNFDGRPIDGILGGNMLSQFALRLDYPAHEIDWISPGNLDDKAAAELGFTPQNRIELGQEQSYWAALKLSHYSLRADFQNGGSAASEDLFIDTGSHSTLVSAELVEKLHLHLLASESVKILNLPAALYHHGIIDKIQIGQSALSNVAVLASQEKNTGIPSILGENVLSDCVVLFDFGPHRFYFKPVLPPTKQDSAVPLDKTQILWDRLRAAPDLPTVYDMLESGFAPGAKNDLIEQTVPLRLANADSAKEVERLEKLGVLLSEGQDKAGSKAAFAQAVTLAAAAAHAHPNDGVSAGQWVQALMQAGRDDEAIAAAIQTTAHLPAYAPGWRQLGDVLTSHALFLVSDDRIAVTEAEALRLKQNVPDSVATPTQTELVQPLLTQAYAAFNKSVALGPADADSYRDRALFHLLSRVALSAIQQSGFKVTLPASEAPPVETALALAVADWQQYAALSPNDISGLSTMAYLDQNLPIFHDRVWLKAHLKGMASGLPATLMTSDTAESRLRLLTQNSDKTLAASAWTALGKVQAEKGDVSDTASEKSWRQALTLDPAHDEALTALASHLHRADRWTELRDLLTHQAAVSDTVPLRLTLAVILDAENLPADAEAQARAAKVLAPNNASVNLMLADLLLARSSGDPAALSEAATCLDKARVGYGTLATPEQKATLATSQAVWLALDHDPDTAEKQLVTLAHEQPNCTQVREALAALVPY